MPKFRAIFPSLAVFLFALLITAQAQQEPTIQVESLTGDSSVEYDTSTGLFVATNGVIVRYGDTVLTANHATVNKKTGETVADGRVRIQQGDQLWVGEHIRYNFRTRQMETDEFRTGKSPVFASGERLKGDLTNEVYTAENAYITTDDVFAPATKVRAQSITIAPGKYFRARNAVFYVEDVPVFYLPYYSRRLGDRVNNFTFIPGYRSRFGPFLLGTYTWFLNEQIDGAIHADYRTKRGPGGGGDVNLHLGRWGETTLKYYYLRDYDPDLNALPGISMPENRMRASLGYDAMPFTNFIVKAVARYQSDELVLHDFFENEYRRNPQPSTFFEVNKFWSNFSLDAYAQPRINEFFETVERLPDVRLTGFRQQLGPTPLYYESESSVGYYRRRFAETNGPPPGLDYSGARADTYHQLTVPWTFYGWLNVIPRVGGRLTYYTDSWGPGATNNEASRGVFNTGAEISVKASRVWSEVTNSLLAMDGLRHIVEPSINYVFVPTPNRRPMDLPQFDSELPSLRLLPIEYPDYNAIDAIDSQNVLRLGLRNKFQTKREGQIDNLLLWEVYTDWRLDPNPTQGTFADIYSDAVFRPRSWITVESQTRYDVNNNNWRLLVHNLTLQPNDRWSWGLGHWYLRDDLQPVPTALNQGNNLVSSTIFFKLNENWALRASQYYELREGRMQEQAYTLYRDLRSWTAAVTLRVRNDLNGRQDVTAAFTFSLKAVPRFGLGSDAVRTSPLLGY